MTELYLDDILADTAPGAIIALSYQINNIADLSNRNGNFSNRLKLPLSKTNLSIIEDADKVTSATTTPYKVLDCRIVQNGIELMPKGKAIIQEITPDGIEINIFSGLYNLFEQIKDLSLRDLNLAEYDHTYDAITIFNARNFDYTDGYSYPVADYGLLPDTTDDLQVFQLYPAVAFNTILNKIVSEQGYTVSGPILENELFLNTFSAFTNEKFENGERFKDETGLRSVQTTPQVITGASIIPVIVDFFEYTLTENLNIGLTFSFDVTSIQTPNLGVIACAVYLDGVFLQTLGTVQNTGFFEFTLPNINLITGETLTISFVNASAGQYDLTFENGIVNLNVDLKIVDGTRVTLEATLPDISQEDWLISFFNQFGLIAVADNLKRELKIVTYQDIYNNKSNGLDWSDKVDIRGYEKTTKFGAYAQVNNLKYKEDETTTQNFDTTLTVNDLTLPASNDLFELEYAASNERADVFDLNITVCTIPLLTDEDGTIELTETVEPRCIYLSDSESGNSLNWLNDVTNIGTSDVYKVATMVPIALFNLKNLSYTILQNGILNKAQILVKNIRLTEQDINELDLTLPVYIDFFGSWFYANLIQEFTTSYELTECTIVQM